MTLTEYKDRYDLTDADLAERVGIARAHITNIRNGVRHPSGDLVIKITKALDGVTAEGLFAPFATSDAAE